MSIYKKENSELIKLTGFSGGGNNSQYYEEYLDQIEFLPAATGLTFNGNNNYIRKIGNQVFIQMTFIAEDNTTVTLESGKRMFFFQVPEEITPNKNSILTVFYIETNNNNVLINRPFMGYVRVDSKLIICPGSEFADGIVNIVKNNRRDELQIIGNYFID